MLPKETNVSGEFLRQQRAPFAPLGRGFLFSGNVLLLPSYEASGSRSEWRSAYRISQPSSRKQGDQMSDRELFEERLRTAEAHTDTKFERLIGEINSSRAEFRGEFGKLATRLDGVERSTAGTKTTIIVTAIAVVAVLIGILAFGQQWFGIGLTTRDIVKSAVTEFRQQEMPPPKKQ